MALATVRAKLEGGKYGKASSVNFPAFAADVRLIFANAQSFYSKGTEPYNGSLKLGRVFDRLLGDVLGEVGAAQEKKVSKNFAMIEPETSLQTILERLPVDCDVDTFYLPRAGGDWDVRAAGVPDRDPGLVAPAGSPGAPAPFATRALAEKYLEKTTPHWLGHVTNGRWQIAPDRARPALERVVRGLVRSGHVHATDPDANGVSQYVIRNLYMIGEPFGRANRPAASKKRKRAEEKKAAEEKKLAPVELSEYELERKKRMRANEAMLASLGF